MKRYWIRIALGAVGIFAIGMLVVAAGRRGVARVRELAMNQTVRLPANVAPFRVDGKRLGSLSQIRITPQTDQGFPRINLIAQLDDPSSVAGLSNCVLMANDASVVQGESGLHCAGSSDSAAESLIDMGTITLEPTGDVLHLFVPERELRGKSWFHHSIPDVPPVPASTAGHQAGIDLQADSSGAFMLIKDKNGHPIFQLSADSTGAFIQIHDSNGKEVVRFRADSGGLSGRVKSQGH
jgi:hypothetical protein